MTIEKKTPIDRLNYSGSLDVVIDRLCGIYGIGKPRKFSIIEVGFEDCNVVVETDSGRYVAKIFSKDRKREHIARYGTIMDKTVGAGVNHPTLHRAPVGGGNCLC